MALPVFGGLIWFPTHLVRNFGMTGAEAGVVVGAVQVLGSVLGALLGVYLTERLDARGFVDAHLRSVMFTALGTAITMSALFMPTLKSTIALWFISVAFQSTYFGNLSAALQIVTPNEATGTNFALFYLTINIFGLAGSTAVIGAISQYGFGADPHGVSYGIASVGAFGAMIASLGAYLGLANYGRAAKAGLFPSRGLADGSSK